MAIADYPHRHACRIVADYIRHCPMLYLDPEKMHHYKWGLNEAWRLLKSDPEPPIKILEREQIKFDSWAHSGKPTDYIFGIVATAYDDLINLLQTS